VLPTARFPLTLRHAASFRCRKCGPAFRSPLPHGRCCVPVEAAAACTLRGFILKCWQTSSGRIVSRDAAEPLLLLSESRTPHPVDGLTCDGAE
jgi:hypothetical protein